jgi:hypothetical protein
VVTVPGEEEPAPPGGIDPDTLDGAEPYDAVDVGELPGWWQRAIAHFEERDLAPYRPPRFADGTLEPGVVRALETELGVSIELRCKNATLGADWTVLVDGDDVVTIGRHRSRERYTVFELTAEEFRERVRSALEDRP